MTDIISQIQAAETRWPQLQFKKKGDEASAPCPFCNNGVDRFLIFADGGYWCRQCDAKGWLDENESNWQQLSDTERRLRILEAEQRRARNEREEQARRMSALERMHVCTDHLRYHFDMPIEQMEYWLGEGMTVDTIAAWQLGYCPRCPTDRDGRASYTIPVYGRDGKLINIRHRLASAPNGDKYRPHMAGLGAQLFNAKATKVDARAIRLTEGEKKVIVLEQEGFPAVGIMGKRSFKREWMTWLEPFKTVYVALDPDALESANRLAAMFNGRARVVTLPVKPDDFFTIYGGSRNDFKTFTGDAKPAS